MTMLGRRQGKSNELAYFEIIQILNDGNKSQQKL